VIAAEDAAGQWSNRDGTGYANDVVREAYRAAGIAVIFKVVPYARCKHLVTSGDVVACFNMSPETGLHEYVRFSDKPLFVVQFDYFRNRRKPLKAKKEIDIPPGTIVGIVIDYEYPQSAMKLKEKGVIFQEARDEETNLRKLALGRIDAAIINHNEIKPIAAMIDEAGALGSVEFAFHGGSMGSYIGFSRENPQGEFARKKFNRGYQIIRRNGTLKRIAAKWAAVSRSHADQ
jgi:polar amino acid transport system substrate-binding protein